MATHFKYTSLLIVFLAICCLKANSQQETWTADELRRANTAASAYYMTEQERDVILYMNLARMYPQKFAHVEVEPFDGGARYGRYLVGSSYKASLLKELKNRNPIGPLYPNKELWQYAKCWAEESGKAGLTGHDRIKCSKMQFCSGECCHYDADGNGRIAVLSLIIDHDVPSLGHRKNILDSQFDKAGVSIQPHVKYGYCCVVDYGCASSKPAISQNTTPSQQSLGNTQNKGKTYTVYTEKTHTSFIDRYYNQNGRNYISLFSGGAAFNADFICTIRVGTLGFRSRLFRANLLDFELIDKSSFKNDVEGWLPTWRPTAGVNIPVGLDMSVHPYLGCAINVNNLQLRDDNNSEDYFFLHGSNEREYMLNNYFYGIAGASLCFSNFLDFYVEARQWLGKESISLESEFNAFFCGIRFSLGYGFGF